MPATARAHLVAAGISATLSWMLLWPSGCGDSDETAIVPGDPLSSLLVHLILLPPDDDDVMPPEGKEPLTQEELGIILDWIRRGAVFAGDPSTPTMHSAGK